MPDLGKRSQFLHLVESYVKEDPEVAAFIHESVASGLRASLQDAMERASDMEVALAVAVGRKHKGSDALILDKLKKWEGRTSCRWDWLTNPKGINDDP